MQSLNKFHKKAFITGGKKGLGRAFVNMLLDQNIEVWATSRYIDDWTNCRNLHKINLDLLDLKNSSIIIDDFLSSTPDVDLLINNSGSAVWGPIENLYEDDIAKQIQLMLSAPIRLCQKFYKIFRNRGRGTIVNISSIAADLPIPYMSIYNTCKSGLSQFTRSLQIESSDCKNIHIIDFKPGDYRTDFNNSVIRRDLIGCNCERSNRIWSNVLSMVKKAPLPQHASRNLLKALHGRKSSSITSGSFIQSTCGSILFKITPWSILKKILLFYYQ